jgi:peptidyl-prolyl cis-trans isomerase A (cyclophilin A)
MGQIIALLHPEHAPQAVAHFAALADGRLEWHDPVTGQAKKAPYYDGIEVHFAMAGRLFEAGYRPGADSAPELWVPLEGAAGKPFGRGGRLGMAAKRPGISGVVFFITASPDRKLDRTYPCFGTVVSELETVYRITEVKTRKGGRPIEPVTIEKIRIFAVGNPAPLPEPVPFFPVRRRLQDN